MTNWDEKAKRDAVQSGKGPGEFGPDYSHRKTYQLGYGNESPSPALKTVLDRIKSEEKPHEINKNDKPTGRIDHWWRDQKGHYE